MPKPPRRNLGTNLGTSQPGPCMIFDLDGTLIDSVYDHVLAWKQALEDQSLHVPDWRIHSRIGMSGALLMRGLLRETRQRAGPAKLKAAEAAHKRYFTRRISSMKPLPGAEDLLRALDAGGIRWAIGTGGDRKTVMSQLELLNITVNAPVITADDVSEAKPEPDVFVLAAQRLETPTTHAIVVGDSVWDLLAARRARALGVGLLAGGSSRSQLEGAGAYRVYDDPADLLAHIEETGVHRGK